MGCLWIVFLSPLFSCVGTHTGRVQSNQGCGFAKLVGRGSVRRVEDIYEGMIIVICLEFKQGKEIREDLWAKDNKTAMRLIDWRSQ